MALGSRLVHRVFVPGTRKFSFSNNELQVPVGCIFSTLELDFSEIIIILRIWTRGHSADVIRVIQCEKTSYARPYSLVQCGN